MKFIRSSYYNEREHKEPVYLSLSLTMIHGWITYVIHLQTVFPKIVLLIEYFIDTLRTGLFQRTETGFVNQPSPVQHIRRFNHLTKYLK